MGASISKTSGDLTVRAHIGDAKTLLAFNMPKRASKNLAGFTVQVRPGDTPAYYLHNTLSFASPGDHAQVATESANSSVNAPFQRFRWLHVPGSIHQGVDPFMGSYAYVVTPRYFDDGRMLPLDSAKSVTLVVPVAPFALNGLRLGFTRGYTQSQAFTNRFGLKALIRPDGDELLFDTAQVSGTDAQGKQYTFEDEYTWLGFTARKRIFELLDRVRNDGSLRVDVFAYDLNEPGVARDLLDLAAVGRVRIILDNASLHHSTTKKIPEDEFEQLFLKKAKSGAEIKRGHFSRFSHDKIFIVRRVSDDKAIQVLTGSTNFSVTGLYVNSNHVLVFDDDKTAGLYADLFDAVWKAEVKTAAFLKTGMSASPYAVKLSTRVQGDVRFSPHTLDEATTILGDVAARIAKEGSKSKKTGSVLFAVMELDNGTSPVYTALNAVHKDQDIFSYGISDNPSGIALYEPGKRNGVIVTGKPTSTRLPPPFNQVRNIGGFGHQIHHKFVVCGFNGADPTVYCGSSNLALGGEQANGDNLLCLKGEEVATVFALEAIGLVDHFQFLGRYSKKGGATAKAAPADKKSAAAAVKWSLRTTDKWASGYFDTGDLKYVDKQLFAG